MHGLLPATALLACGANAIVIRDDVADEHYRIPPSEAPAVADMPGEGHGVLIAPQWVVTAAHAVTWQHEVKQIMLGGVPRNVERIVLHPGYRKPPQQLIDRGLATWDWVMLMAELSASDDIALIKLVQPVADVVPVPLHTGADEYGQTVMLVGKGATGNGRSGFGEHSPHRTQLRRAYNKVTSAHGRWFCYKFDQSAAALPLEGAAGNGDSGGPVLIQTGAEWRVAGLTSWVAPMATQPGPLGQYGQISCNVRLSHYADWIAGVMAAGRSSTAPPTGNPVLVAETGP
jgi:chymotrypsin